MRNFKFFTMIFAIMATLCFTACENDNDKKQETNACEPASCEMTENATEMGCDDAGHCIVKTCADTFKIADDAKSCEAEVPKCDGEPACSPACDGSDCICRDGAWTCIPADVTDKCDPNGSPACATECKDDEGCICQGDEWKCVPKNDNPTDKCLCDDDTDCPDGDKDKCPKEPTQPVPVK